jgi:asparagine synthase (glutamine-hydrolysing)
MSAIVGIQQFNSQAIDPADLQKMVDILAHRGSDGSRIWCEGAIGLGHRMLWSTPESLLENMPWIDDRQQVITADVRLDNREELISALALDHCPAEKITDSQIILAAYSEWKEQCVEKLLGDFAFAIWDSQAQSLFCARDHFGVKPFFYYAAADRFVFASEIKALLAVGVPKQLNETRVGDFLTSLFDDTCITFYQDILRLPPAHTLTVSATGIRLQRYWQLDPNREIRYATEQEYADRFRELFTEAVRCRLRSAFPVGSFLSGGLDSSSIACVAEKLFAEAGKGALPTFSAVFEQVPECDERSFQNAVLAQGNFDPHYFHADQAGPMNNVENMLWHQDEPFFAGNLFLTAGLYNVAQKQGVRVTLDGFDGDSTVSHGVGHLRELALTGQWLKLWDEAWGKAQNSDRSVWQILRPYIWNCTPLGRLGKRIWRLFPISRPAAPAETPLWNNLNPEFVQRTGLAQRHQDWRKPSCDRERDKHYQTLTWGLVPYALEMIDRAAAAAQIEPRFPFWDKRLVEFCLALPPEQKLHHGWGRWVMRQAMANILPEAVQWRVGKTIMSAGFCHGLLKYNRQIFDQTILHDSDAIAQYINIPALRQAHETFIAQPDKQDSSVSFWTSAILTLWLQQLSRSIPGGDDPANTVRLQTSGYEHPVTNTRL